MKIELAPELDIEEPKLFLLMREDPNGAVRAEVGSLCFDCTLQCMRHLGELGDLPDDAPQLLEIYSDVGTIHLAVSVEPGPYGANELIRSFVEFDRRWGRDGSNMDQEGEYALFLNVVFVEYDSRFEAAVAMDTSKRLSDWAAALNDEVTGENGELKIWSPTKMRWI